MYRTRDYSIADFIDKMIVKDVDRSVGRDEIAREVRIWFQTHHNDKTMDPQLVFARLHTSNVMGNLKGSG
jgi:RNase P protein component